MKKLLITFMFCMLANLAFAQEEVKLIFRFDASKSFFPKLQKEHKILAMPHKGLIVFKSTQVRFNDSDGKFASDSIEAVTLIVLEKKRKSIYRYECGSVYYTLDIINLLVTKEDHGRVTLFYGTLFR